MLSLNIYNPGRQQAFKLLAALFGGSVPERFPAAAKSERKPYMALHFDRLMPLPGERRVLVSLAQYYEANGDLVSDPDMQLIVDRVAQTVDPVTFQNAYTYEVALENIESNAASANVAAYKRQLSFLLMWLRNCRDQGHQFATVQDAERSHANVDGAPCQH